jgi:hypothetical protein
MIIKKECWFKWRKTRKQEGSWGLFPKGRASQIPELRWAGDSHLPWTLYGLSNINLLRPICP